MTVKPSLTPFDEADLTMSASIQLFHPFHCTAMEDAAVEVLRSGQIAAGAKVQQFQTELGQRVGNPRLLATSDMSSAMQIALRLANVGPQDEVLTTAFNCMSSNAPIANLGAVPTWVDVQARNGLMDPTDLEAAITSRSKACVVYHAAGYPADIATISTLCRRKGIALIEDCNNAFGATIDGQLVGSFGDMAVYSFYPNRQINASEGGAISVRNESALARATHLRRFGIDMSTFRDQLGEINPSSDIPEIGWSASMNNLCAAIALAQLDGLEERLISTQRNASELTRLLSGMPGVQVVETSPGARPSFWALLLLVEHRDAVLRQLKQAGIMASKLHHRIDSYSGFCAQVRNLPGTSAFMQQVMAIPCGWWLEQPDLERIAAVLADAASTATRSGKPAQA